MTRRGRTSLRPSRPNLGTRDLVFAGHHYHPEHAGFNDAGDVERLHEYLAAIDPGTWSEGGLLPLPELATAEERREEIEYVRDWWPSLVEMYGRARAEGQVIICEEF